MKYYKLNYYGKEYNVRIERTYYTSNNTLALSLITDSGEPFCTLTVNIADSSLFADKIHAFVDTNNCPFAEEFIAENNLGFPVGYVGHSGFCSYPLYHFYLNAIG